MIGFTYLLLGIIILYFSGEALVSGSVALARHLKVQPFIIALTLVAFGTSAPELATSITAAIKGRHGIALGNLIGSDLFNLLGVLGLAGVINPTIIEEEIYFSVFNLIMMVGLVLLMMRINWNISRTEGSILVFINLVRWYFDFAN